MPVRRDCGRYTYLNPGSVALPKENSPHSYMTLEENTMQWKELESSAVFHELTL